MTVWRWLVMVLMAALAAVWWWRAQQPLYFHLQVVNVSQEKVTAVEVFGSGVVQPRLLASLLPGAEVQLVVELASSGELRVAVSQGLNKIDSLLSSDVGGLDYYRQRLSINNDHRYIFSAQD